MSMNNRNFDREGFANRTQFTRRSLLVGASVSLGAMGLAGCVTDDGGMSLAEAEKHYGAVADKKFPIAAVDITRSTGSIFAAP